MLDILRDPDEEEPTVKTWVEVTKPIVQKYKLRSHLTEMNFVMGATESGAVADVIEMMAKQIDDHKQQLDAALAKFKWGSLYGYLMGYFTVSLLNYLTS